jgi:anti-sigma factor RsiW
MSCSHHETGVFLHAHNQLSGLRRWLVESHIHACPVCRARWAQWTVERDRLRRAFSPLPPDPSHLGGVTASVAARIRVERPSFEETPRAIGTGTPLRSLALVAVVVAILAAGISALAAYWPPPQQSCASMEAVGNQPSPAGANAPATCPGVPLTVPADAIKPSNNTQPAPLFRSGAAAVKGPAGAGAQCSPVGNAPR